VAKLAILRSVKSGSPELAPSSAEAFADLCAILPQQSTLPRALAALADAKRAAALLILAEEERVLAAVHEAVEARYANSAAKAARAVLATHHEANRRRNRVLRQVLLELGAAADRAGFGLVALKGSAWLLEDEPGCASWREMVDLDVLVDPRQFDSAPRLLQAMGYTPASTAKRFEVNFHHAPYQHPTLPFTVEVHRHLGWRHHLLSPELPLKAARPLAPGLSLAPAWMRLFHAVIHWQVQDHGGSRGSLPLRELVEVARFLGRSDVDWAAFSTHAARVEAVRACEIAIASASALLNAPVPPQLVPGSAAHRWVTRSLARRDSPLGTWVATQRWRAGTLWWCDKVRYRAALQGARPAFIALRVWGARIIRLPLLAVRATTIALQALLRAGYVRRPS
jgi:hypothetical protein